MTPEDIPGDLDRRWPFYDRRENPWPIERLDDMHDQVLSLANIPNVVVKMDSRLDRFEDKLDNLSAETDECRTLGQANSNTLARIEQRLHDFFASEDRAFTERENTLNRKTQSKGFWIAFWGTVTVAGVGGFLAILRTAVEGLPK